MESFIQRQDGYGNYYFTGEKSGKVFRIGDRVIPGPNFRWGDNKTEGLIIYQFHVSDRYGFDPKPENNGKVMKFVYAGVEKGNWERQTSLNNLDLVEKIKEDKYNYDFIL